MSPITTHVLDTARGKPAAGVAVQLSRRSDGTTDSFTVVGTGATDADGRLRTLLPEGDVAAGTYRLVFDTESYFGAYGIAAFFPEVAIHFVVGAGEHYHVPLLLSPFGYSTYRGS